MQFQPSFFVFIDRFKDTRTWIQNLRAQFHHHLNYYSFIQHFKDVVLVIFKVLQINLTLGKNLGSPMPKRSDNSCLQENQGP